MNALLLIIVFVLFHILSFNLVHKNGSLFYSNVDQPKIYDIIHENFPNLEVYSPILENIFPLMVAVIMVLTPWNVSMMMDFVSYGVVIYFIRDIFINTTILPISNKCDTKFINYLTGGCFDKIFSGHVAFVLLASILFYKYAIITDITYLTVANILHSFFMIVTHGHYTVDVLVSILVTFFIYQNGIKISLS